VVAAVAVVVAVVVAVPAELVWVDPVEQSDRLTAAPRLVVPVPAQPVRLQAVPSCPSGPICRGIILRQHHFLYLQRKKNFAAVQRQMLELPGTNTFFSFSFFSPDQFRSLNNICLIEFR
jgi:hypothetical protein